MSRLNCFTRIAQEVISILVLDILNYLSTYSPVHASFVCMTSLFASTDRKPSVADFPEKPSLLDRLPEKKGLFPDEPLAFENIHTFLARQWSPAKPHVATTSKVGKAESPSK